MKSIDTKKAVEFVSKTEREKDGKTPKPDATIFLVKMVSTSQQAIIRNDLYQVSGTGKKRSEKFKAGTQNLEILKLGLVGWRNFLNEDGKEIEFDPKQIVEMIDKIPPAVTSEIANFVQGESELDEGEE